MHGEWSRHIYFSSQRCSRCGCINRDLRGAFFKCKTCGLRMDRHLNAAINLYLKMEGVPREGGLRDKNILPTPVGGYFQSRAEQKAPYADVFIQIFEFGKLKCRLKCSSGFYGRVFNICSME